MYGENVVVVGLTRATARGGDAVILEGEPERYRYSPTLRAVVTRRATQASHLTQMRITHGGGRCPSDTIRR
jgi:hypothetical protein